MLAALASCEAIDDRYGERDVRAPAPLSAPPLAAGLAGPLKPPGGVGGAPRRALRETEMYGGAEVTATRQGVPVQIADAVGEPVNLNFVRTEISEVVDLVLGQILGETYALDPRVSGEITTRTARPIPRRQLRAVLENLLAANGAAIVDDEGVATVVPIDVARTLPRVVVPPGARPQARGYGTYFIPLQRADATSMAETISGQISSSGTLSADTARNLLIFTGPQQEAEAVEEMAEVLDVDLLAGRSFALVPLEVASPATVAQELEALVGGEAGGAVVPVERMNAVLTIANSPRQLRDLNAWVDRLDRADAAAAGQLFVYYVRSGLATELAETLNAAFGTGTPRSALRPGAIAPGLDVAEIGTEEASAEVAIFNDGAGPVPAAFAPGGDLRIVADEKRNALVVRGAPSDLEAVQDALRRLDTQPIQILIEATIAEVLLNDELEYGLRWAFETGDFSGILTDAGQSFVGPSFPGFNLIVDTAEAQVVLRALAQVTEVEVVSSPQLMVLENQTARLQVGDQVPILTQELQPITDVDALVRNAIAYIPTGVILEVTPSVNADGLVSMQVSQEVSDAVRNQVSDIDSPIIQQREVNSTVAVRSGQTVALGGLIRERREEGEIGIPLLKDIPIAGNLFKTTSRQGQRTELLVLITPRVIRDELEASVVTRELRDRLTRLQDVLLGY